MITLVIDASTYAGSVALLDGDRVAAVERVAMRGADEERLLPAVAAALRAGGMVPAALERIVCGAGPGSFTSLRIAASIAKGLAAGTGTPLFAISSLALLVASSEATRAAGTYVAALDALRGEHYVAATQVDAGGDVVSVGPVERWRSGALRERAAALGPLVGIGLDVDAHPDAGAARRLAPLIAATGPVTLSSWEPSYGRLAEAQVKWEAAHGRPLAPS